MLGIAPKNTIDVDLVKPLHDFIKNNYSVDEAKNMESTIREVNDARAAFKKMSNSPEGNLEGAIDLAEKYMGLLDMTSSRLPFSQEDTSSFFKKKKKSIVVVFPWNDAFQPDKQTYDYSVSFEKAAILFNIGAFYSLQAIRTDRSNEVGLKKAFASFQKSAGVFTLLATSKQYNFTHCNDMTSTSYRMLSHLMLAQAQACFFEQAIKKNMSPGVISKLAMGASKFFGHAYQASNSEPISSWLRKSKYNWKNHLLYQQICFEGASHFWRSKTCIKEDLYGQEIAELGLAAHICQDAEPYEKKLISGLRESRLALVNLINSRSQSAIKDNDTIYCDVVPHWNSLPVIEPKLISKAIPYEIPNNEDYDSNPFGKLVPMKVHNDAVLYKQQLSSIMAQMSAECKESHDFAKMHLDSLNLPAALQVMEMSDNRIPESLLHQHQMCREQGGYERLVSLQNEIQQASSMAVSMHDEIKGILDEEKKEDEAQRQKWGEEWSRPLSDQLNMNFYRDLATVEGHLAAAASTDTNIAEEIRSNMEALSLLSLESHELEAGLPKVQGVPAQTNAAAEKLRSQLDQLSESIEKRSQLLADLGARFKEDDIETALIQTMKTKPVEQVFVDERKKHEPMQKEIMALLDDQKMLLDEISKSNDEFVACKTDSSVKKEAEDYLTRINVAVNIFTKLEKNLREGQDFYGNVITDYMEPLKNAVLDFRNSRDEESMKLLRLIQQKRVNSNAGGGDAIFAPPPQHQPPSPEPAPGPAPNQAQYQPYQQYQQPQQPVAPQQYHAPQQQQQYQQYQPVSQPYQQQQQYQQPQQPQQPQQHPYAPSNNYGGGYVQAAPVAPSAPQNSDAQWPCPSCTFLNPPLAPICGMCESRNPNEPVSQNPAQQGWRDLM